MLNYSKKLTEKPSSISEEDVRGLRRVGLTDREILDLTLVVAYFNFVNRIALGLGVELEPDFEKTCKEDFG
ncbi:MAG: carboxymuconolactone decarboxylase family protein [Candidatus Asgardarchaeia archaeon]